MVKEDSNLKWSSKDIKSSTQDFINHIYETYYKSYKNESEHYEKINNWLFATVTAIGFLVTIILGLKEILKDQIDDKAFTILAFILPSISSVILLYMSQKGYKRKEDLRGGCKNSS